MPISQFIHTSKMYSPIDTSTYNTAKRLHLNALHVNYANMDTREKWRLVMAQFGSLVPAASRATVSNFTAEREPVIDNPNAINLEDCLNYFEQFYFLHTTTDPLYQLSESEKTNLQKIVLSGMGNACETGKQERFDMVLMLYRQDTHWIKNELAKYRYNLLQILQERYNTEYAVGVAYSPHTFKLMKKLAKIKGFGVNSESELHDIHMLNSIETRITQYFELHYPQLVSDFENSALDNLAQNLMLELSDFLHRKNINCQQWDSQGVVIPEEHHRELNDLFESKSFSEIMIYLRDDADGIDDWVLQLKKKGDVLQGLRALISETLSKDRYIIDVAKLHDVSLSDLQTKERVEIERLVKISRTLDNVIAGSTSGDEMTYLKKHHTLLLQYPAIIRRHISQTPEIYSMLPDVLKTNALFIAAAVTEYEQLLLDAIKQGHHEGIRSLTTALVGLVAPNMKYLDNLSQDLLDNRIIAHQLIKQDALFLKKLTKYHDDDELVWVAVSGNGLALKYASARLCENEAYISYAQANLDTSYGMQTDEQDDFQHTLIRLFQHLYQKLPVSCIDICSAPDDFDDDDTYFNFTQNIEKMHAIHVLSTEHQISAHKTASLVQILTPELLVNIINERRANDLPPLPFCFDIGCLNQFSRDLAENGIRLTDGYLQAKKHAATHMRLSINPNRTCAVAYLATSNNWYTAFVQYQQKDTPTFQDVSHFLQLMQDMLYAMAQLLLSSIRYTLFFVDIILETLVVLAACLALFAGFIYIVVLLVPPDDVLDQMNELLQFLCLLGFEIELMWGFFIVISLSTMISETFIEYASLRIINFIAVEEPKFLAAFNDLNDTTTYFIKSLYSLCFTTTVSLPNDTLKARCESSIDRLQFILKNEGAHQKGALLADIWNNIQKDIGVHDEPELRTHLDKKYTVNYQGKTHELSFFDVASTKRQHADRFSINEPKSMWRFFADMKPTTTTDDVLNVAIPAI